MFVRTRGSEKLKFLGPFSRKIVHWVITFYRPGLSYCELVHSKQSLKTAIRCANKHGDLMYYDIRPVAYKTALHIRKSAKQ